MESKFLIIEVSNMCTHSVQFQPLVKKTARKRWRDPKDLKYEVFTPHARLATSVFQDAGEVGVYINRPQSKAVGINIIFHRMADFFSLSLVF